jgi:hypothetical protein
MSNARRRDFSDPLDCGAGTIRITGALAGLSGTRVATSANAFAGLDRRGRYCPIAAAL